MFLGDYRCIYKDKSSLWHDLYEKRPKAKQKLGRLEIVPGGKVEIPNSGFKVIFIHLSSISFFIKGDNGELGPRGVQGERVSDQYSPHWEGVDIL